VSSIFNFKPRADAGFSILELAIVLVILGILGGASIPLLKARMNREAVLKTRENQIQAIGAIAAFVEKNHRFPCPADPKITGADYGVEPKERKCQRAKAEGILPFRTLGISEATAKDGFKRFMTYAVDPNLADREYENQIENAPGGWITVKNEEGFSVIVDQNGKSPNFVAFVLISHGESGTGAFVGKGQSTKLTSQDISAHKKENLDGNFAFVESSQTDDMLKWVSRDHFLKHYMRYEKGER
jgi:prepilin-type N-terminal cleavage/methylation domain-containing protein